MVYVAEAEKNENRYTVGISTDKDEAVQMARNDRESLSNYDAERTVHTVSGYGYESEEEYQEALETECWLPDAESCETVLTRRECRELAQNLNWGNPYSDPDDIKDSLRTNFEKPMDEESVETVYNEMCRIRDEAVDKALDILTMFDETEGIDVEFFRQHFAGLNIYEATLTSEEVMYIISEIEYMADVSYSEEDKAKIVDLIAD